MESIASPLVCLCKEETWAYFQKMNPVVLIRHSVVQSVRVAFPLLHLIDCQECKRSSRTKPHPEMGSNMLWVQKCNKLIESPFEVWQRDNCKFQLSIHASLWFHIDIGYCWALPISALLSWGLPWMSPSCPSFITWNQETHPVIKMPTLFRIHLNFLHQFSCSCLMNPIVSYHQAAFTVHCLLYLLWFAMGGCQQIMSLWSEEDYSYTISIKS